MASTPARRQRRAAARKRPSKREQELRAKLAEAQAHLAALQREARNIEQAKEANRDAANQMLGRVRTILEDLGEAPPLAPAPAPPEAPEGDASEEPKE